MKSKTVQSEAPPAVAVQRFVGHRVSWFSTGGSSAVATMLAIAELDQIIYVHIDDQHPDSMRFVNECAVWFGKPITILQSDAMSVEGAIRKNGTCYINGPAGAECTRRLKKRVRQKWEQENVALYPMQYVWGMDASEQHRADRIRNDAQRPHERWPMKTPELQTSVEGHSLDAVVRVHYRNWRGEERTREVRPISLRYGRTDWHPNDQWLLLAVDEEDARTKEFALKDCDFLHPNAEVSEAADKKR
jgi:hypothetical protein